jgi:hypothetical protein
MENLPNIWFYTFSTVAQVMAASVGLFAVFVVYRIQDFSNELDMSRQRIVSMLSYVSANTEGFDNINKKDLVLGDDFLILRSFRSLLDYVRENPGKLNIIQIGFDEDAYEFFEGLVLLKEDILLQLKEVVTFGFGIIIISVLLLAGTELTITKKVWSYSLIAGVTALFVLAMYVLGRGIYRIIKIHRL